MNALIELESSPIGLESSVIELQSSQINLQSSPIQLQISLYVKIRELSNSITLKSTLIELESPTMLLTYLLPVTPLAS